MTTITFTQAFDSIQAAIYGGVSAPGDIFAAFNGSTTGYDGNNP